MRLYLSSYNFGDHPEALFEMADTKKVGIIRNATDLFPEAGTNERLQQDIEFFKEQGFNAEIIDLRDYFDNQKTLENKIRDYGLIWTRGANVFVLRRAMAQSGMDKILTDLLEEDSIVYGGFSAGACVLSNTLKGLELVDDHVSVPTRYDKNIIWDGLGILDFVFVPHFESDHPESPLINKTVSYLKDNNIKYRTFRDGQALVIKGSQQFVV